MEEILAPAIPVEPMGCQRQSVDNGTARMFAGVSDSRGNKNSLALVPTIAAASAEPITRRRQSMAGGALFAIDDAVVEMGADYLRCMLTMFNRFDPFQRLSNGPLRMRSRSVDGHRPLATIREVVDNEEQ